MVAIKKYFIGIKILLPLVIPALVFVSCGTAKFSNNINGGFENESEENYLPVGWYPNVLPGENNKVKISLDEKTFHGGGKSICFDLSDIDKNGKFVYKFVKRIPELQPSEVYDLSAWIKTKNIHTSPFITIECYNDKIIVGRASTKKISMKSGTQDWKMIGVKFKVPQSTNKILLLINVPGAKNYGGKVWIDDVDIQKVE
jgi:hypothetical protein